MNSAKTYTVGQRLQPSNPVTDIATLGAYDCCEALTVLDA